VRTVVPPASLKAELEPWMAGKAPTALLFTAPEGGPLWTSNFCKRQLDQAAKQAGLSVTPHDLRHTAASLAISSGANVLAVQRMLGHASAAMTLDTYVSLFDSDLEAVAGRLDEAISGARADSERTADIIQPIRRADGEAQNAV
jgi:integrase